MTDSPSSWLPPRRCVRILFDICIHFLTHDRCVFVWCLTLGPHSETTNQLVVSEWGPKLRHQTNTQSFSGNLNRSMTGQSVTYSRLPKSWAAFGNDCDIGCSFSGHHEHAVCRVDPGKGWPVAPLIQFGRPHFDHSITAGCLVVRRLPTTWGMM